MFSLETEMHARYVCDMSSVQWYLHCAVMFALLYSKYSMNDPICECVWMYSVWLCIILLMFVSYYFWLKRQRCLYDANAFVWGLALALPGWWFTQRLLFYLIFKFSPSFTEFILLLTKWQISGWSLHINEICSICSNFFPPVYSLSQNGRLLF